MSLGVGLDQPNEFAKQAVNHMQRIEGTLLERIRAHYGEECQEVLKAIRMPIQIYSEQLDWDVDLLRVAHSLRG